MHTMYMRTMGNQLKWGQDGRSELKKTRSEGMEAAEGIGFRRALNSILMEIENKE